MGDGTERVIQRADVHYAPLAANYVTSAIHARGADLQRMVALSALGPGTRLLDVGTGAGHTALAFAAHGIDVTGLDMTHAMLDEARTLAQQRKLRFDAIRAYAEHLPFADAAFDGVACRYCAHHFRDIPAPIYEMRRVLRADGVLVFVDHVAPEDDEADAFINRLDWLRDPSHQREPRLSEYERWFAAAGLVIDHLEHFRERMLAADWFARARTSPEREAEARRLLATSDSQLRTTFAITDDPLSFDLHVILVKLIAR